MTNINPRFGEQVLKAFQASGAKVQPGSSDKSESTSLHALPAGDEVAINSLFGPESAAAPQSQGASANVAALVGNVSGMTRDEGIAFFGGNAELVSFLTGEHPEHAFAN